MSTVTPSERIQYANSGPRCAHVKLGGDPCRAPALRGQQFCHFHSVVRAAKEARLPLIEDSASVQFAIMQITRALFDQRIEHKTAALLLYSLQISCTNLAMIARQQRQQQIADPYASHPSLAELIAEELGKEWDKEEGKWRPIPGYVPPPEYEDEADNPVPDQPLNRSPDDPTTR